VLGSQFVFRFGSEFGVESSGFGFGVRRSAFKPLRHRLRKYRRRVSAVVTGEANTLTFTNIGTAHSELRTE
jgi:hypothetical protein